MRAIPLALALALLATPASAADFYQPCQSANGDDGVAVCRAKLGELEAAKASMPAAEYWDSRARIEYLIAKRLGRAAGRPTPEVCDALERANWSSDQAPGALKIKSTMNLSRSVGQCREVFGKPDWAE